MKRVLFAAAAATLIVGVARADARPPRRSGQA